MSKELEALKIGIPKLKKLYENSAKKMSQNDILGFDLVFVYLDKALQRLESIDNANPSEALERVNSEIIDGYPTGNILVGMTWEEHSAIKQTLLKAQEQEKENVEYKKVLKVIKEKEVSIFQLNCCKNVNEYNDLQFVERKKLTEEEFDLLKKHLDNKRK